MNPGKSMSVSFKPMSGILMQNKYLPLMWGGFTMDFELIGNADDAFVSPGAADAAFFAANTATNWSIQDIRMTGDVVTLDSALQNSYAEHVFR